MEAPVESRIPTLLRIVLVATALPAIGADVVPQMWDGIRVVLEPNAPIYVTTLPPSVNDRHRTFADRASMLRYVADQPAAIRSNGVWFTRTGVTQFSGPGREAHDRLVAAVADEVARLKVAVFACEARLTEGTDLVTHMCAKVGPSKDSPTIHCEPQVKRYEPPRPSEFLGYRCFTK